MYDAAVAKFMQLAVVRPILTPVEPRWWERPSSSLPTDPVAENGSAAKESALKASCLKKLKDFSLTRSQIDACYGAVMAITGLTQQLV